MPEHNSQYLETTIVGVDEYGVDDAARPDPAVLSTPSAHIPSVNPQYSSTEKKNAVEILASLSGQGQFAEPRSDDTGAIL